jgi:protein-disulfide isomerase
MKDIIKFIIVIAVVVAFGFGIFAIVTKKKDPVVNKNGGQDSSIAAILKLNDADQIRGSKDAKVTIINYSDYQCPYCVTYDKTLKQVIEAYPTQVKWVYRHFPLSFHQTAKQAAIAAEAAGLQGKYWEFSDLLVENSQADGKGLLDADLLKYAIDLGLDLNKFKSDLTSQTVANKVESDTKSGDSLNITGTPASYLVDGSGNIETLKGALTLNQLKAKIDPLLK